MKCCHCLGRHDVGKRAASLVGRVEHKSGAAGGGGVRNEFEIDAAIGQQDADEQDVGEVEFGEALQRLRRACLSTQPHFDDVGAGGGHGENGARRRLGIMRRIADGGAHRDMAWHARADRLDGRVRQRAQRAGRRVLGVDDIGGEMRRTAAPRSRSSRWQAASPFGGFFPLFLLNSDEA